MLVLITAIFVSISASLLGSFVVLKRMSLVGDALSHVALPGLAIGILLHFDPFIGAFIFLFMAITGIWFLKYRTRVPIDALVGIFFTSSLALGVLLIPQQDLLEAMFGDISTITISQSIISIIFSLILLVAILIIYKKLALNMVSDELSHSVGIDNKKLDFVYLFIFAVAVAIGIRFVGALLMGALVIIPAASAKNVSKSLSEFMVWSVVFGVISAISGTYLSYTLNLTPGPLFILSGALIFVLSSVFRWLKFV